MFMAKLVCYTKLRHDFNSKQDSTELSKHVWELKKTNKDFEIR